MRPPACVASPGPRGPSPVLAVEAAARTPEAVSVGDEVLVRDWRTGEPFRVWSVVTGLKLRKHQVERVAARDNAASGFVIVTVDHAWWVPKGQWARDVLGARPAERSGAAPSPSSPAAAPPGGEGR